MTWQRDLSALASSPLPCASLGADVLDHLRRPFAPAAVKWKVQSEWTSGALLVAYIDARLVIERLNLVWPWWEPRYEPVQGGLRCTVVLFDPFLSERYRIVRSDVGQGADPKTLNSDALKRAAVGLGVGLSIYSLARVTRKVGTADSELRAEKKRKKKRDGTWVEAMVPIIDPRTEKWLGTKYEEWLEAKGEAMFGPVLDHGDEPDSQGLDTESPAAAAAETGGDAPVDEPVGPEPLTDDRAVELRRICEGWYGQFRRLAPAKLPPAAFQARLAASSVSHELLEAFVEELETLVREHGGGGADA